MGEGGLIQDPSVLPMRRPEHAFPLLLLGVEVETGPVLLLLSFLLLPYIPLHISGSFLKLLPFWCLHMAKVNSPCRQGRPVAKAGHAKPSGIVSAEWYKAPFAVLSSQDGEFVPPPLCPTEMAGLGRFFTASGASLNVLSPGPEACPRQVSRTWGVAPLAQMAFSCASGSSFWHRRANE